jgi:hypothetical protein
MVFSSMEAFLLLLEQSNVLHMQYVKTKIFVYPPAQEPEPEEANPFPYITEVRACYRRQTVFSLVTGMSLSVTFRLLHITGPWYGTRH